MSSLFNQASLVLVPSGYKAGKVYSEVPTNGDGDLTFTRASSATRVNSDGLIESPRTNFIRNSSMVGAVAGSPGNLPTNWGSQLVGLSQEIVSIGTENGLNYIDMRFFGTATGTFFRILLEPNGAISASNGQSWTFSTYFKIINSTSEPNSYAQFIFEQTSAGGFVAVKSQLFTPTTNLQRLIFTTTLSGGATVGAVQPLFNFALTSGQSYDFIIRIAAPQMELSSVASDWIPTTTSVRTTFAGITQDGTSASNIPRLDYSQGSCPALLLEPQRTNLALYSEEFGNASWSKSLGTITANATTAPDGTLTADLFTKTSAVNTVSQISNSTTVYTTTGVHTLSVYIKPNVGNLVQLRLDNSSNTANFTFNFTTKTFSNSGANVISSSFDELPNGWFRLKVTGNVTSTSWSLTPCLLFANPINDSMYVWGAQLEVASYATSYIKTTNATVTRLADDASKTALIDGDNPFTFMFKVKPLTTLNGVPYYFIGNNNLGYLNHSNNGTLRYRFIGSNYTSILTSEDAFTYALAFNNTDLKIYFNGTLAHTIASAPLSGSYGLTFNGGVFITIYKADSELSAAQILALNNDL